MSEKYYLALFNKETWNEFLEKGSSVYGITSKRQKSMESTNPGDYLICYVTKLSRFVGLLEITSKAYLDDTPIWKSGTYPIRVKVRPIYILKPENGLPVLDMKEDLTIFRNLKSQNSWSAFFRMTLKTIQDSDAKVIVEKIKEASNN